MGDRYGPVRSLHYERSALCLCGRLSLCFEKSMFVRYSSQRWGLARREGVALACFAIVGLVRVDEAASIHRKFGAIAITLVETRAFHVRQKLWCSNS
eukprot:SAG31_NODE_3355_length_4368_cov_9.677208_1_plen_97_part_00